MLKYDNIEIGYYHLFLNSDYFVINFVKIFKLERQWPVDSSRWLEFFQPSITEAVTVINNLFERS